MTPADPSRPAKPDPIGVPHQAAAAVLVRLGGSEPQLSEVPRRRQPGTIDE